MRNYDYKIQMLINVLETDVLKNRNNATWEAQLKEINRIEAKSILLQQRVKMLNVTVKPYCTPEIGKYVLVTRCGMQANAATHKVGQVVPIENAMHAYDNMSYWGADIKHAKCFVQVNDNVYGLGAAFKVEILN